MTVVVVVLLLGILYPGAFGSTRSISGLLTANQMIGLDFPVVIRADDGARLFCSAANDVFDHFEPQDLCDTAHFGWDSRGRRFSFADWETHGRIAIVDKSSWDDFDATCAAAYRVSPEIAQWRARATA